MSKHIDLDQRTLDDPHNRIFPLTKTLATRLEASVIITSLEDVLVGLIKNSLESGARRINITIHLARGSCTVEDDGIGILPDSFQEGGGLCEMHSTSKPIDSTGSQPESHGTFLAALATTSLLSITSKHQNCFSTNHLMVNNSQTIVRRTPVDPAHQPLQSPDHGTFVAARNIFGAMPVRAKHYAHNVEKATAVKRAWSKLVRKIAALLLAWTFPIDAVTIEEKYSSKLVKFANPNVHSTPGRSGRLSRLVYEASILTSSHLLSPVVKSSFTPVSATMGRYRVKGMVSSVPSPDKSLQFISLGAQPLASQDQRIKVLHAINTTVEKSAFAFELEESSSTGTYLSSRPPRKRANTDSTDNVKSKGVDRWLVFHLKFDIRGSDSSTSVDQLLPTETMVRLAIAVTRQWLASSNLCIQRSRNDENNHISNHDPASDGDAQPESTWTEQGAVKKRRAVKPAFQQRHVDGRGSTESKIRGSATDNFSSWSRIKSSSSFPKNTPWETSKVVSELNGTLVGRHFEQDTGEVSPEALTNVGRSPSAREAQGYFPTNVIRDALIMSPRPGNDVRSNYFALDDTRSGEPKRQPKDSEMMRLEPDEPFEFTEVLKNWTNPVFDGHCDHDTLFVSQGDHSFEGIKCSRQHNSILRHTDVRLSRAAIEQAIVIAQVDHKYILIDMPPVAGETPRIDARSMLVVVDQHAASERVIVEQLVKSMVAPIPSDQNVASPLDGSLARISSVMLSKPISFTVDSEEDKSFRSTANHFANWGVVYDVSTSGKRESVLKVTHLPPVIAERCTQDPRLLIELLRDELYQDRVDTGHGMDWTDEGLEDEAEEDASWLRRLRSCPRKLLDLVNSRSCRSAVMFNDELSLDECKGLIGELAKCAFPFMCAHGRVSMVPVLELGEVDKDGQEFSRGLGTWSEDVGGPVDYRSYLAS